MLKLHQKLRYLFSYELLPIWKITFLSQSKNGYEKTEQESNRIPYPE